MLDPDVQSAQPRIIKRYANRKLYDTRSSRYVTLPQIAELVRSGEDVQIIDNRSKENLTSVTLAQIIYESEKSAEASSRQGVKTLRDLIQLGGEKLMAHFREGPVGRFIPRAPEMPDLRELRDAPLRVVAPAVEALEELHRRADEKMRTFIGGVLAPLRELAHEVAKLEQRIEELENRIVHRRDRGEAPATAPNGAGTESAVATALNGAETEGTTATAPSAAETDVAAATPEPAAASESPPPASEPPSTQEVGSDHPATPEP